ENWELRSIPRAPAPQQQPPRLPQAPEHEFGTGGIFGRKKNTAFQGSPRAPLARDIGRLFCVLRQLEAETDQFPIARDPTGIGKRWATHTLLARASSYQELRTATRFPSESVK